MTKNIGGRMQNKNLHADVPRRKAKQQGNNSVKTSLSKRLQNRVISIIEGINSHREEKPLDHSESLKSFMARFLKERSELKELEELIEIFWEGLEEKGYGYGHIKQAEFNINQQRSLFGHPETRQTWAETLPPLQQIIDIAKTEGRELLG